MASKKSEKILTQQQPATTVASREQQLVRRAIDLAEKQLIEGTASAAVITHYLKIGSTRESIEREILEKQAKLIEAKASSISKDRDAQELAKAALEAMQSYGGSDK